MHGTRRWLLALVITVAGGVVAIVNAQEADPLRYTAASELQFPAEYREWVYLSSGLGMTYSLPPQTTARRPSSFTNVFVNPASYREFMKSGRWPDRTVFVLEIRGSTSEGSINKGGQYQTAVQAIEAEVKDSRLSGGWAFYNFGTGTSPTKPLPATENCYSCHKANGAVEQTFVQFYPSLMDVARLRGTVNPAFDASVAKPQH